MIDLTHNYSRKCAQLILKNNFTKTISANTDINRTEKKTKRGEKIMLLYQGALTLLDETITIIRV